ncbi:hypothetical protein [Microbulbifer sp. SAOS-129_SWC]|uniref:hypothetical protein n=1 Tax=Microbulbifer sp. SAOS-129_SWC TaxID=3145235 RepID=UPI0032171778
MQGRSLERTRDPVCGEEVPANAHAWTHQHIKYAFCSERCRERFKRWPHLYVGEATWGLAEKQRGKVVRKRHGIRLAAAPDDAESAALRDAVAAVKGVLSLDIRGDRVLVDYDLMQVSLSDIEAALAAAGSGLDTGVAERARRAMIHHSEACELDNLAHLASHYRSMY